MRYTLAAVAVCLTTLLVGCNPDVPPTKVTGKVTLDGAVVETGLVRFEPTDGKSPSAKGGIIKNGEYSADVPVGEAIVRITSPKVLGKRKRYDTPDSPMDDILEERIPKKYNANSTLKETIQGGQQELNFKLVSDGP